MQPASFPVPGLHRDDVERSRPRGPAGYRDAPGSRRPGDVCPHLSHGRRVGRGDLEQHRARCRCSWRGSSRAAVSTAGGWVSTSSHAASSEPLYMALIGPFRHLIVYPALMRQIERAWDARPGHHDVLMRNLREGTLVVLYDAHCGFCAVMVAMLLTWDRAKRLDPVRIQSTRGEELLMDVGRRDRLDSWHLVDGAGVVRSGGAAVPMVFAALPGGAPVARVASQFPRTTSRAYVVGWQATASSSADC